VSLLHADYQSRVLPPGSAEQPLPDEQLIALFRRWAGPHLPDRCKDWIIEPVLHVEQLADVRALTVLLRPQSER
jgi:hypothetical protein